MNPDEAIRLLDEVEAMREDTTVGTPWWILRHPDGRRLSSVPTHFDHPYLGTTFVLGGMARRWRTKAEALKVVDEWRALWESMKEES